MSVSPRRVLGLTWVGWSNLLVCQWLGFRLARVIDAPGLPEERQIGYTLRRWRPIAGWSRPFQIVSVAWSLVLASIVVATVLWR